MDGRIIELRFSQLVSVHEEIIYLPPCKLLFQALQHGTNPVGTSVGSEGVGRRV